MPSMAEIDGAAARADPQIPILSEIYTHYDATQTQSTPMKPQVYTVSGGAADISASPMTEVVDNHSVDIDPFSLTETVGKSRFGQELNRQQNGTSEPGVVRELWSGFLEDLLGPKQQRAEKH